MTRMFSPRQVLLAAAIAALPSASHAARIKDITLVEGGRDNQLVGYGIVVGLAGDGDSNSNGVLHVVANILQRYAITVSLTDLKSKNVAAVMVTADIARVPQVGRADRRHGRLDGRRQDRFRAASSSRRRSSAPTGGPTRSRRGRLR